MDIKAWIVKGCGGSMVCYEAAAILFWMNFILDRGGVPEVKVITGGRVAPDQIGGGN